MAIRRASKEDTIVFDLQGAEDLERKIQGIIDDVDRATTHFRAVWAGAEVLQDEAIRLGPGPFIAKDLAGLPSGAQAEIGPDREHWYYGLFETGTTEHEVKARQAEALYSPGIGTPEGFAEVVRVSGMAAKPFLRPAADNKKDEAIEAVMAVYREEAEKYAVEK